MVLPLTNGRAAGMDDTDAEVVSKLSKVFLGGRGYSTTVLDRGLIPLLIFFN